MNATPCPGQRGTSNTAYFDIYSAGITIPYKEEIDWTPRQQFSLTAWFKTPYAYMGAWGNYNVTTGTGWIFGQWHISNLILIHYGTSLLYKVAQIPNINQWNHIAVAYDGTNKADGIQLYCNGQPATAIQQSDPTDEDGQAGTPWMCGNYAIQETANSQIGHRECSTGLSQRPKFWKSTTKKNRKTKRVIFKTTESKPQNKSLQGIHRHLRKTRKSQRAEMAGSRKVQAG